MKKLKIMFDTNTWQQAVIPEDYKDKPNFDYYLYINNAIKNNIIDPYISETIFTLEGIRAKERKDFISNYEPKTNISSMGVTKDGYHHFRFTMAPNPDAHSGNNEYLNKFLNEARKIGFSIIGNPIIGKITNKDIEPYILKMNEDSLKKAKEIGKNIISLNSGFNKIKELGKQYNQNDWIDGISNAPVSATGKAMAEWADGESVISHIALGGDFFCTNDHAQSAGTSSVFSKQNVTILKKEYKFRKVSPEELVKIIKRIRKKNSLLLCIYNLIKKILKH